MNPNTNKALELNDFAQRWIIINTLYLILKMLFVIEYDLCNTKLNGIDKMAGC